MHYIQPANVHDRTPMHIIDKIYMQIHNLYGVIVFTWLFFACIIYMVNYFPLFYIISKEEVPV